jgi:hypothetical protein
MRLHISKHHLFNRRNNHFLASCLILITLEEANTTKIKYMYIQLTRQKKKKIQTEI